MRNTRLHLFSSSSWLFFSLAGREGHAKRRRRAGAGRGEGNKSETRPQRRWLLRPIRNGGRRGAAPAAPHSHTLTPTHTHTRAHNTTRWHDTPTVTKPKQGPRRRRRARPPQTSSSSIDATQSLTHSQRTLGWATVRDRGVSGLARLRPDRRSKTRPCDSRPPLASSSSSTDWRWRAAAAALPLGRKSDAGRRGPEAAHHLPARSLAAAHR